MNRHSKKIIISITKKILKVVKFFIPRQILQIIKTHKRNKKLSKKHNRKTSLGFRVPLADHCNLNCKSCTLFSPIAKEKFLDVDLFQKDCQRIAELSAGGEGIDFIYFYGGEPLLHSNIIDIIEIGKKYFPKAKLDIITNGILLSKQTEEFWEACSKNDVKIRVSYYPIKINRDEINNLARKYNVYVSMEEEKLYWCNLNLDEKGAQNIENNFKLCPQANNCIILYEGKLYTCPIITSVNYLNSHFGKEFLVTEDDYIDIYKAQNMNEILEFLSRPVPFCRYCNVDERDTIEWGISKKEIGEWVKLPID